MVLSYYGQKIITPLTVRESASLLFLTSVMTFPRAYVVLKLSFLMIFLLAHFFILKKENRKLVHLRILVFYLSLAAIGLFWSAVGLINGGALAAIIDSLRLYVLWSAAFFVIFSLLLRGNVFLIFHKSVVIAGILVSGINIIGLVNYIWQLNWISVEVIQELNMFIGIHAGYIQITSHNIGSLFFIAAYLMAIQFRKDMRELNGMLVKISLFMCFAVIILSGRRALWIAISMVPFLVISLSMVTGSFSQLRWRKWLSLLVVLGVIPVVFVLEFMLSGEMSRNDSLSHLQTAFSASDERTIQKSYLINGFKNYPIFGSGFGIEAGYLRSEESPWLYELTYHQMLFNHGLFGVVLLGVLMGCYFIYAVTFISQRNQNSGYAFGMIIAIVVFLIGAYSNPYLWSFDFLMLLGVFPVIAASFNNAYALRTPVKHGETNNAEGEY